MPAQKREFSRNYIGILADEFALQREAAPPARPPRPVRDYLRVLVAAVLNRGGDAR